MIYKPVSKAALIFGIAIAVTTLMIFGFSMIPPETSGVHSNTVSDVIVDTAGGIIDTDTEKGQQQLDAISDFLQKHIRRLAHFLEYGLLGFLCAMYLFFRYKKENKNMMSLPYNMTFCLYAIAYSVFVSFLDESIQILSKRGPDIADMWVDIAGFFILFAICFAVQIVIGERKVDQT